MSLEDKREARRTRRARNQFLSYLVVILLLLGIAFGVVYALGLFPLKSSGEQPESTTGDLQSQVEAIINSEETIDKPVESTEPVVILTWEEKMEQLIASTIDNMPLEDKVAGLFIVTPEAISKTDAVTEPNDAIKDGLNQYAVGGLYFRAQNMKSEEQLTTLVNGSAAYSRYALFLATTEEGGKQGELVKSGVYAQREYSESTIGSEGDTAAAYQAGFNIASKMTSYGFNLNFAPSCDLASVENSAAAYNSYGSDAKTVSGFMKEMLRGMTEWSLNSCAVHFPGIGGTTQSTADGIAVSNRTAEEFRQNEFQVFQAAIEAQVPMIMVGHMAAPALTGDNIPCSLSAEVVTNILRNELGYQGVIISDALNKKAISEYYGSNEAAVMALKAGCDMLLMPENFEQAYNAVLEAVENGTISEQRIDDALTRIYFIKYADKIDRME